MANVFEELDKTQTAESSSEAYKLGTTEINFEELSNVPIGLKKKFVRINLGGKTVTITKAILYSPDTKNEQPITALNNPAVKYFKSRLELVFQTDDAKIDKETPQREFYSGTIFFVNKDNTLSAPSFWNAGAENQVSKLWVLVAVAKNKGPEQLSPREFMAFLNNQPKALLRVEKIKFKGQVSEKNVVENFV